MGSVTLKSRAGEISRALRKKAGQIVRATVFEIEAQTKRNIQEIHQTQGRLIDTGLMLNSVGVEVLDDLTAAPYVGAEYGVHQELGAPAANIPPTPFFGPAIEAVRPAFEAAAGRLFEDGE